MIGGTCKWAIGGAAFGAAAAHACGAVGLLVNAGAATTALAAASVFCLGPVGFGRAASDAAEGLLLEPVGAAVGKAVDLAGASAGGAESLSLGEAEAMVRALAVPGRGGPGGGSFMKDTLHSSGPAGAIVRLSMAVFLPRTDFMLDHIVAEVNASARAGGAGATGGAEAQLSASALRDVSVGAAKGLVAATTDDVRSKVTALGILAFAVAGGGAALALDRAERAYRAKKAALEEKKARVRERVDAVKAAAEDAQARAAETAGRAGEAVDEKMKAAKAAKDKLAAAWEKRGWGRGGEGDTK